MGILRSRYSKKDRQHNSQKKEKKGEKNKRQKGEKDKNDKGNGPNVTQITIYWEIQTPQKWGVWT